MKEQKRTLYKTSKLIESGISHSDASLASQLAKVIRAVDRAIFGADKVARIIAVLAPEKKIERDILASYRNDIDAYEVWAQGLSNGSNGLNLEGVEVTIDWITEITGLPCSVEHLIASIAVHEVRHRVQRLEDIALFYIYHCDPSRRWTDSTLSQVLADIEFPSDPTGRELDAYVIQYLALTRFVRGEDPLEVARDIIRLTPESATRR